MRNGNKLFSKKIFLLIKETQRKVLLIDPLESFDKKKRKKVSVVDCEIEVVCNSIRANFAFPFPSV